MRNLGKIAIAAALTGLLAQSPAAAQTYNAWTDPDAETKPAAAPKAAKKPDPLKALVNKIDALVTQAEKDRAANPQFLKDLRAAIRPHQPYWGVALFDETFADGEYTTNPTWTPIRGTFAASKRGLAMSPRSASGQSQQTAAQLLNSLLTGQAPAPTEQGAIIALEQSVPNIFLLDVILRAADLRAAQQSAMRIGVTQGTNRRSGYWVAVEPGARPTVGLYAITRSGVKRLGVAEIEGDLLAGEDVRVQWQRRGKGFMRVYVDKKKLIEVTDPTFKDPFDSIVLASDGMDTTVRRVRAFTH